MAYMTEHEVMCRLTTERDKALDSIDDMVDVIAKQIRLIARDNEDFICTRCLSTARELFGLMKKYAREEDTEDIRSEWKEITGADIEEWR